MEAPATSIHSFVDYSASGGAFSFANNPFQQQMASCVHQRESVLIFPHSNGIVPENGFPIAPGAQPMSELPDTKVFGSTITTSTSHSIQTELPKAKRMDEDCWTTEFGVHADNGLLGAAAADSHHQTSSASSLLIRDDFIFSDTAQCSSPPSNTLAGNTEFIYEPVVPAANSILEDAFLSVPNPLLEAPCTSFASSAFMDPASAYRFRDGSVGISPCSSSTQISTGTTDDSIFLPQTIHQQQQQHSSLQHQFLDGIFRSIPLNVYPASTNQSHHQFQVQDNGLLFAAGRESGVMDGEGNDDDEEEEQRDVKPVFLLDQQQQQRNDGLAVVVAYNGDGEEQHLFGGDDEEYSALSPPPPPPPLTPPSKTRSKMHDLALKHRLITNQNMRGHGQIQLSTEEKKTLIQEGFPIPSKLPLMREEEEALKIVRRKIKNKLSAQESRRKRKEYMDMLEKRAHVYFADNTALRQKIRQLETTNRYLLTQLQHKPATGDIAAESVQ